MPKITSEVTNTVTIENTAGLTETFIFKPDSEPLVALHTSVLLSIALSMVEQKLEVFTKKEFELGLMFCEYEVGFRNDEIVIKWSDTEEFILSLLDVIDNILLPFDPVMPDLVQIISEHEFDHGDIHCWLLEDLTGYYSGGDSDIWILTNQGMLIATEELHGEGMTTYLSPVAVYDLNHHWTEEEIKNSDLIKGIVKASY